MQQLDLFKATPVPRLPRIFGRCLETNKFYDDAAAEAMRLIGEGYKMLVISISKTGHVIIDSPNRADERYTVITITHRADPEHISETLKFEAIQRGFDEGIRRGVKPACKT